MKLLPCIAVAVWIATASPSAWGAGQVLIVHDGVAGLEANVVSNLSNILTTAGFTVSINVGVPGGTLSGYTQVWDVRYNTPLSGGDNTSYTNYLTAGGSLFLMGENTGFASRNDSITALIASLGAGSISLSGANNSQTVLSPFTGPNTLTSITFLAAAGTADPGRGTFITRDAGNIGSGLVYAPGALTSTPLGTLLVVFDVNFMELSASQDSQNLTKNMVAYLGMSASTTAISSSVNPSTPGQSVTFTASVTGGVGAPTGTVTFKDGSSSIGSATLSSGIAAFTTSALSSGSHSITAYYSGDATHKGSSSAPITQGVGSVALIVHDGTTGEEASGDLIISEFRLRGPNGANDEFVEIYNTLTTPIQVSATDGSAGYALAASNGVTRFVIPNGTLIPGRGHYLGINSVGYSLASYPAGSGATATGDATYTTDIADNAGIALFKTSNPANFNLANRLDAAGSTSEANTLYREGSGYPALVPFSIDYSFSRDECGNGGAINPSIPCTRSTPRDTDSNAADFVFVDTNGTSAGAGQRLGAPGPENLSSPARSSRPISVSALDTCTATSSAPNRVRDFTSDPPNNSTFGAIDLRRTFINNTGAPLTRLRFSISSVTTFPAPSGIADLRPRTSTDVVVTVDRPPCGSGTSNVTVHGTTLEQPPSQPNGGGFNSTLSSGTVTLATPLAPGASIDVRFLFGIQQTGNYRIAINAESLPAGGALWIVEGNTESGGEVEGGSEASVVTNLTSLLTAAGFVTDTNVGVPAVNLGGYNQIWDVRDIIPLSTGDNTIYTNYLASGGSLSLIGENTGYAPARNSSITSLIGALGGGSISLSDANNSQTVLPPFTGPNSLTSITFSGIAGTADPGRGAFFTEDAGNNGSGLVYAPGALTDTPSGSLLVLFDADFLETGADQASHDLARNMISYLSRNDSTTVISSSVNPSTPGQSVTFTATVTGGGGTPTGTVTFKEGASTLAEVALSSGSASYTTSALSAGSHRIEVSYSGDMTYKGSVSSTLVQGVGSIALIVHDGTAGLEATVVSNLSSILTTAGYTVDTSVGVTAGNLGGYGQVWDLRYNNTTPLTASVNTVYTNYLAGGGSLFLMGENTGFATRNNSIVALIASLGGGSISLTTPANSQTVLDPFTGPNPVTSVTFQATAGTSNPGTGGFITKDASNIGAGLVYTPGTLANALAGTLLVVFDVNFMDPGSPDPALQELLKNMVAYLARQRTATTILSGTNPSTHSQPVTFFALVDAYSGTPSGSVTFKDGAEIMGSIALTSGVATLTTNSLSLGSHSITAVYSGDDNYKKSFSAVLTQTVLAVLHYVKLVTPENYFVALIDAYAAIPTGTSATLQATQRTFDGSLNLNKNVALTLNGGYEDTFSTTPGVTSIQGVLTVTSGSLTASKISVE